MPQSLLGPVVGIALTIFLSFAGVVIARFFGTEVASASLLTHASAGIVLLVMILVRLEALRRRG